MCLTISTPLYAYVHPTNMVMYSERHDSISGIISVSSFSENWKEKKKRGVRIAHSFETEEVLLITCSASAGHEQTDFTLEKFLK